MTAASGEAFDAQTPGAGESESGDAVTDSNLLALLSRRLKVGRDALPQTLPVDPQLAGAPLSNFVDGGVSPDALHRLAVAGLYVRTLDGLEACSVLWCSGLDVEVRAHLRVAFEHLVTFAWLVADSGDARRGLQLAQHGAKQIARQVRELEALGMELSEREASGLRLAADATAWELGGMPSLQARCRAVDDELGSLVRERIGPQAQSFSFLYSYLYRGASAFAHAGAASVETTLFRTPEAFVIGSPRARPQQVLQLCCDASRLVLVLAQARAPWLVPTDCQLA